MTVDSTAFPPVLKTPVKKVNGELRQNSNTGLFIHGIEEVICELTKGMTLKGRNDHRNRNAGRSRHGIRTAEIP